MTMALFDKIGKTVKKDRLLRFHFDPPEITDDRDTDWPETKTSSGLPTLSDPTPGSRVVTFTLLFNDFALGRERLLHPGVFSTKDSIRWLRARQQANPGLWEVPPTLVFTGLSNEVGMSEPGFNCVITSTKILSKIHAGHHVLARSSLLPFPVQANDVIRATVAITLKEKVDPTENAQSLVEAFEFGVREGARGEEGQ